MSARLRKWSRSVVALCAVLALAQTGCGRKALSAEVSASELLGSIHEKTAPLILDVRTPEEFARGHVPGARTSAFSSWSGCEAVRASDSA